MSFDMGLLAPFEDCHAGHLLAVVEFYHLRLCPYGDNLVQLAGETGARQRCIGNEAQAFAGKVIHDGHARFLGWPVALCAIRLSARTTTISV